MGYALREGLSYCVIDGHPVFLDLWNDRYFRLSSHLEDCFNQYASEAGHGSIKALVAHNIMQEVEAEGCAVAATKAETITQSVLERTRVPRFQTRIFAEVFFSTYSIRRQLRKKPLIWVTHRATESRPSYSQPAVEELAKPDILRAADDFNAARAYVPIETRCLLDSLAMISFLGKRGHYAEIVIGVTTNPFSAHCWTQSGNVVLNDTVGHVNAFTPVRVI